MTNPRSIYTSAKYKKMHVSSNHFQRARDLFYALWIPDLFMRRVEANQEWSLMCPNECPGLADVWGEEFDKLYEHYEKEGRARLYKDACNRKSNQQV